ncbi:MAG TPA: hypothetical protein VJ862_13325 [Rhodanobacteraceae bacterium]|nr:hypothetical protein [Rhodanobacteraceae bacterium]
MSMGAPKETAVGGVRYFATRAEYEKEVRVRRLMALMDKEWGKVGSKPKLRIIQGGKRG